MGKGGDGRDLGGLQWEVDNLVSGITLHFQAFLPVSRGLCLLCPSPCCGGGSRVGRVNSPGGAAQCEMEQQGGHGWAVQGMSQKLLIPDPPSCHLSPEEIVLSFSFI